MTDRKPLAGGLAWWGAPCVEAVCIFCGQRFGYWGDSMYRLARHFEQRHGRVVRRSGRA